MNNFAENLKKSYTALGFSEKNSKRFNCLIEREADFDKVLASPKLVESNCIISNASNEYLSTKNLLTSLVGSSLIEFMDDDTSFNQKSLDRNYSLDNKSACSRFRYNPRSSKQIFIIRLAIRSAKSWDEYLLDRVIVFDKNKQSELWVIKSKTSNYEVAYTIEELHNLLENKLSI